MLANLFNQITAHCSRQAKLVYVWILLHLAFFDIDKQIKTQTNKHSLDGSDVIFTKFTKFANTLRKRSLKVMLQIFAVYSNVTREKS